LLLTNDGDFAHRITAPESHVKKTYVVKVTGPLTVEQERQFQEGIPLHGRKTSPAELKRIKPGANPWYEVKITEGRQNQIRVMFKHFGRLVEKLRRVKIAFLELDQAPGRYRMLTQKEIERFQKLLKMEAEEEPRTDHEIRAGLPARGGGKKPAAEVFNVVAKEAAPKPDAPKPARPKRGRLKPAFRSKRQPA
jgi:23S rRNA pseudouridine2605 synthase